MQSSFKTQPVGLWKWAKRNEQDTKKDLPPPFKLWSSGKSSENVFPPASVCQQKRARLLPCTHRPRILPTAVGAARRATPLLRDGWKTFNEEPLKSNECPSENWVSCECWLGIRCWTIDPGASAVYVPQSLISNIRWWEKTKKGLQAFTLCIWPHFTAKLLRFIYSR